MANEVVVKTLANSKTFQRFALRTDTFARENLSKVEDTLTKTIKEGVSVSVTSKTDDIRAEIEKLKEEINLQQRRGNLDKVAELTYMRMPELETQLKDSEKTIFEKLHTHLFTDPDHKPNSPERVVENDVINRKT